MNKLTMAIGALGLILAASGAAQAGGDHGGRYDKRGYYGTPGNLIGVYILGGHPERRHVTRHHHRKKHVIHKRYHPRPAWVRHHHGWKHGYRKGSHWKQRHWQQRHWKHRHWKRHDRHWHGSRGHDGRDRNRHRRRDHR